MSARRGTATVLLPFALHGLAREVDGAVGTLLHTSLDLADFVLQALRLLQPGRVLLSVLAWTAAGGAVWCALGFVRARREHTRLATALEVEATGFGPLYLRYSDVWDAARTLADVLATGDWDRPEYHRRAAVT